MTEFVRGRKYRAVVEFEAFVNTNRLVETAMIRDLNNPISVEDITPLPEVDWSPGKFVRRYRNGIPGGIYLIVNDYMFVCVKPGPLTPIGETFRINDYKKIFDFRNVNNPFENSPAF